MTSMKFGNRTHKMRFVFDFVRSEQTLNKIVIVRLSSMKFDENSVRYTAVYCMLEA